jgi:hypothetical protein
VLNASAEADTGAKIMCRTVLSADQKEYKVTEIKLFSFPRESSYHKVYYPCNTRSKSTEPIVDVNEILINLGKKIPPPILLLLVIID